MSEMEVHLLINGPVAGRVLRINTSLQVLEGAVLSDLLEAAEGQIGIDILTPLREGSEHPVILLSGENLELPTGLEQPLQDGDEVVVLQGIAGG